jgi:hypothetical protein
MFNIYAEEPQWDQKLARRSQPGSSTDHPILQHSTIEAQSQLWLVGVEMVRC